MIEINNVTKKFGDFTAIENMSFKVENGSIYGLVGYNGAGKTTLLKTISDVYRTDGGNITLDGKLIKDSKKEFSMFLMIYILLQTQQWIKWRNSTQAFIPNSIMKHTKN